MGELILKENRLIVTFKRPVKEKPRRKIVRNMNLLSIDDFCDKGWIRVDLKPLYTLHIN